MANDAEREGPGPTLKFAIAGVLVVGAVASGYFVSRQGRRVLKEALAGRRRSRLEDRVLDLLWGDPDVGGRTFDVEETEPGTIALSGVVHTAGERDRALEVAGGARDVKSVQDRLTVEARRRIRPRFLAGRGT